MASVLPWTAAARRNLGYLYAISQGAHELFDADAAKSLTENLAWASHSARRHETFCTSLLLPSTPLPPGVAEDTAPRASLDHRKAQAAPAHPGAPPGPPGRVRWP